MTNYIPLGGIIIAAVVLAWIVVFALAAQREGLAYSTLSRWAGTPLTLPTDSTVGPRVETQEASIQIANGGGRPLWIEWDAAAPPFYPADYTGGQNIRPSTRGGRILIDPGQHVFFPAEDIRLSPRMGCDREGADCQEGFPFFDFVFNSSRRDTVLVSAEMGTTFPFGLSYFSREDKGVTTMTCSLSPDEFRVHGDSSAERPDLLRQNCIVTQSPVPRLVGTPMFVQGDKQPFYMTSSLDNRFKITFYDGEG